MENRFKREIPLPPLLLLSQTVHQLLQNPRFPQPRFAQLRYLCLNIKRGGKKKGKEQSEDIDRGYLSSIKESKVTLE